MSHEEETKQTPAAECKAPETEAKAPEQEAPKAEKPEEKHEGKHHHEDSRPCRLSWTRRRKRTRS